MEQGIVNLISVSNKTAPVVDNSIFKITEKDREETRKLIDKKIENLPVLKNAFQIEEILFKGQISKARYQASTKTLMKIIQRMHRSRVCKQGSSTSVPLASQPLALDSQEKQTSIPATPLLIQATPSQPTRKRCLVGLNKLCSMSKAHSNIKLVSQELKLTKIRDVNTSYPLSRPHPWIGRTDKELGIEFYINKSISGQILIAFRDFINTSNDTSELCEEKIDSPEIKLDIHKGTCVTESVVQFHRNSEADMTIRATFVNPNSKVKTTVRYEASIKTSILGREVFLPKTWRPMQSHTNIGVRLKEQAKEYKAIQNHFCEGMEKISKEKGVLKINFIERIQNLFQLCSYQNKLASVVADIEEIKKLNTGVANRSLFSSLESVWDGEMEFFGFHGTRGLSPSVVTNSQFGFDARLSGSQNMWGPGLYFSLDSGYTHPYSFACRRVLGGEIEHRIIYSKIIKGLTFNYGNLCSPYSSFKHPILGAGDNGRPVRAHSITGITKESRVFKVSDGALVLPLAIISYSFTPAKTQESVSYVNMGSVLE